jgi:predicted alpha/beta superfamily hydrolase
VAQSNSKLDNGYQIKKARADYGIYHSFSSKSLKREMPLLVFLPSNYSTTKKEFPVVYLLHGVNNQPLTEEGIRQIHNPDTKPLEMANLFKSLL